MSTAPAVKDTPVVNTSYAIGCPPGMNIMSKAIYDGFVVCGFRREDGSTLYKIMITVTLEHPTEQGAISCGNCAVAVLKRLVAEQPLEVIVERKPPQCFNRVVYS